MHGSEALWYYRATGSAHSEPLSGLGQLAIRSTKEVPIETNDIYVKLLQRLKYPNLTSEYLLAIMRRLITPEEGVLLLELPAEPADLAQKLGLHEDTIRRKLQELMEKGVIIGTSKGLRLVRDVIQFHDASLSSSEKWVDTDLLEMWKGLYEAELFPFMKTISTIPVDPYVQNVRVVPAWKAIERSPNISVAELRPEENLRELIRGADVIAVIPCTCRRSLKRCNAKLECCVQFNRGAEYAIGRGAGRKISADEAMAIFKEAEEAGLVHTWPFAASSRLNEICNCCIDCCIILDGGIKFGTIGRTLARSHLRADVNQEICDGCQDCVERCFFEAIEMKKTPSTKKLKATVDVGKCFGCGVCAVACDLHAIRMKLHQP